MAPVAVNEAMVLAQTSVDEVVTLIVSGVTVTVTTVELVPQALLPETV